MRRRRGYIGPCPHDRENSAASCDEPPVALAGSRVEDERSGLSRAVDAMDWVASARPLWITLRRQDHAHSNLGTYRDALAGKPSLRAAQEQLREIEIEERQNDLRFRIAEAAV